MKKTLSIIGVFAAAHACVFGAAEALWDSIETDTYITLSDETTVVDTQNMGYIISYWWSDTDGLDNLKAVGVSAFADFEYGDEFAGYIFNVTQALLETPSGATGYLGVRIFQVKDMIGKTDDEWIAYLADLNSTMGSTAGSDEIDSLWASAQAGGSAETGEWMASYVASYGGSTGADLFGEWFGWAAGALPLTMNPIPEPASVAALFGILAIGFAVRRRRK